MASSQNRRTASTKPSLWWYEIFRSLAPRLRSACHPPGAFLTQKSNGKEATLTSYFSKDDVFQHYVDYRFQGINRFHWLLEATTDVTI
jgi:hypothetical protein